jgi:putative FmdB family regulatory protein
MPLYEYYCEHCDGIFENLKTMRESSEPSPCPVCDRDAQRIMPTSFAAFTFRDGIPRRIPDKGTHWHLGKEVKKPITGGGSGFEHPELNPPEPKPVPTKGEAADTAEKRQLERRHLQLLKDSDMPLTVGPDRKPILSADQGASGHAKG